MLKKILFLIIPVITVALFSSNSFSRRIRTEKLNEIRREVQRDLKRLHKKFGDERMADFLMKELELLPAFGVERHSDMKSAWQKLNQSHFEYMRMTYVMAMPKRQGVPQDRVPNGATYLRRALFLEESILYLRKLGNPKALPLLHRLGANKYYMLLELRNVPVWSWRAIHSIEMKSKKMNLEKKVAYLTKQIETHPDSYRCSQAAVEELSKLGPKAGKEMIKILEARKTPAKSWEAIMFARALAELEGFRFKVKKEQLEGYLAGGNPFARAVAEALPQERIGVKVRRKHSLRIKIR